MEQGMSAKGCARFLPIIITAMGLCSFPGCLSFQPALPPLPADAIKPVVAVTTFRNETGFSGQWELGRGIPDLLVAELLQTKRVVVVDRQNLPEVVGEIARQGNELFRKEDGVTRGRLKNARYLVRGVISDFTQTGNTTGWFRSSKVDAGIWGARALVMINLTIIDVESGEVLCSVPAEGSAYASFYWTRFNYQGVSFGNDAFFKTPIGAATREAIQQAVVEIMRHLPLTTWRPRIAEAAAGTVIINGGENYGVQAGAVFNVREAGRTITDPTTGNAIDYIEGSVVGQVRITQARPQAADGIIISGKAKRGDFLEKSDFRR